MSQKPGVRIDLGSYVYCFVGMVLFSTTEIAGKLAGNNISPVVVTIIRFFIGSVILLPFASITVNNNNRSGLKSTITIPEIVKIVYPGVINVAGAMLFLQFAIYYGTVSMSAILISSNPLFVAIFATLILKEELTVGKTVGVLLGLAGMCLVIIGDNPAPAAAINPFLGFIFGLFASLLFGLYTVLAKRRIAVYGNAFFNAVSFAGGAAVLLLLALLFQLEFTFVITAGNIYLLLYMGIFITGIAYIFFFNGLKKIPAANGSIMFFFKPVIAVLLAVLCLGESITGLQIVGVALIMGSVYITNLRKR